MNKTMPYYTIEPDTEAIIRALMEKCKEFNLGNCSFEYYNETTFYIIQFKDYWELRAVSETKGKRYMDMYRIADSALIYQYTE